MNVIKRLRRAGLSRADIRVRLGVTRQVVGMWERGERFPGRESQHGLILLAKEYGIRLLAQDFHVAPDRAEKSVSARCQGSVAKRREKAKAMARR
jgi:transcriptional regulator with XRE-family HTH domain